MQNITIGQVIATISTLTVIVSFLLGMYKVARSLEKLKDNINENTMYTLKLVILNEDLGIEERIKAGDRYISLGGNGYVKHIYENLIKEIDKKRGE